jgi:hypothetical protein
LPAYTYPSKETGEGRQTGLVLSPASGEVFAEADCASAALGELVVKGSVIAVVAPLETRAKTLALTIKQTSSIQEPSEYETEAGEKVTAELTCKFGTGTVRKCGEEEVTPKITLTSEEVRVEVEGGKLPPRFEPAKGSVAFPVAFTSSGGETIFHAETTTVKCTGETGSGEFTGVKEGKLTLKFSGCKGNGKECGNVKEGEIETKELKVLPAYTYPSKETGEGRQTGLVLSPASGEVFAEADCESAALGELVVKGSVVAVVTPLETRTKTLALAIKQTGSIQEPSEYETETGESVAAELTCKFGAGAVRKCGEEEVTPKITLTSEEATIEAEA